MVAPDVEIDDGKGTSLFAKLHLYEIMCVDQRSRPTVVYMNDEKLM